MNNNPHISEQDIEKLLSSLPQYQMSKKKEFIFYAKLMKLAREMRREERKEAVSQGLTDFFGTLTRRFASLRVAVATFGVFILFIGTVGFSLSPKVTRGHFLYPVKQTEEKVELAFARDPLSRVNTHMRFADRRLDELEVLFKGNPELFRLISAAKAHAENDTLDPLIHETLDEYFKETSKATTEIAKIEQPEIATKALETVELRQEKHVRKLEKLLPEAAQVAKPFIAEAIVVVEKHRAEIIEKKIEVVKKKEEGEEKIEIAIRPAEEVAQEVRASGEASLENFEKREEKAKEEFEKARAELQELREDLISVEGKTEEVTKFEFFVEEKLKEAEAALSEGNYGKVFGLSRASEHMTKQFREFEEDGKKVFRSKEEAREHFREKEKRMREKFEKQNEKDTKEDQEIFKDEIPESTEPQDFGLPVTPQVFKTPDATRSKQRIFLEKIELKIRDHNGDPAATNEELTPVLNHLDQPPEDTPHETYSLSSPPPKTESEGMTQIYEPKTAPETQQSTTDYSNYSGYSGQYQETYTMH